MAGDHTGGSCSESVPGSYSCRFWLAGGIVGSAYLETITAQGGSGPYSFSITGGAVRSGLTMSSAGIISGTPTLVGTFSFTVSVTDANSNAGSQAFTIAVAAPSGGGASTPSNYSFVA
jgi:hypothetical protein